MRTSFRTQGVVWAAVLAGLPLMARAQVSLVRSTPRQVVFRGIPQTVEVSLRNPGAKEARLDLALRLWQPLASTAAPLGEARPCGTMSVPAGSTVTRRIPLTLPATTPDRVLVQWIQDGTRALGAEAISVVPPDVLKELGALAGKRPLVLHDPERVLIPVLNKAGVKFRELQTPADAPADADVVILGPFTAAPDKTPPLPVAVRKALRRVPVVIAPQTVPAASFLREEVVEVTRLPGRVEVCFPPGYLSEPATRARSQLRLLELVRLSLRSETASSTLSGL